MRFANKFVDLYRANNPSVSSRNWEAFSAVYQISHQVKPFLVVILLEKLLLHSRQVHIEAHVVTVYQLLPFAKLKL